VSQIIVENLVKTFRVALLSLAAGGDRLPAGGAARVAVRRPALPLDRKLSGTLAPGAALA